MRPRFRSRSRRAPKPCAFGADRLGRDVLSKVIKGAEVSIFVGVFAAVLATLIGTILGAVAGYVGGRVGDFLEWVYNVFTSIPGILLIFAFAAVLGRGISTVILILGLAGWTGIYRLVRAEYIKHRTREYVRAAEAIGASHFSRMFIHILPNVSHVVLVQLSLHVVFFIKAEVILSFLGLGVRGRPGVVGHDAVGGAGRVGARALVATGRHDGLDGVFCHRVLAADRRAARRARSEIEVAPCQKSCFGARPARVVPAGQAPHRRGRARRQLRRARKLDRGAGRRIGIGQERLRNVDRAVASRKRDRLA